MKILIVALVGILAFSSVFAETFSRPYVTCISPNQHTKIDVLQNTDVNDMTHPYFVSVYRRIRGNSISMLHQNAFKNPIQHEEVIELFQNSENKSSYPFQLMISTSEPSAMVGTYRAFYSDFLGHSVVYCSYHITFGN